jgi:WD40 repeat protein
VWDLRARRWLWRSDRQKDRIWRVAFSPDGRLLASAGNSSLGLWNARTGAPLMSPLTTDKDPNYLMHADVAFSPDGRLLAYRTGGEGTVLWDVARRRPSGPPLGGHKGLVQAIAFSPDGRLIATGGNDGAVILWDAAARQPVARFAGRYPVWTLAFRPDGGALAVEGDRQLVIWDVNEESWREEACRLANRNLSREEWGRFLGPVPYRATCSKVGR